MPKGRAQGGAKRPFKLPAAVERSDRIWQAERNVIEQARAYIVSQYDDEERLAAAWAAWDELRDAVRALEAALKPTENTE